MRHVRPLPYHMLTLITMNSSPSWFTSIFTLSCKPVTPVGNVTICATSGTAVLTVVAWHTHYKSSIKYKIVPLTVSISLITSFVENKKTKQNNRILLNWIFFLSCHQMYSVNMLQLYTTPFHVNMKMCRYFV